MFICFRKIMYLSVDIVKGEKIKLEYIIYKGFVYGLYVKYEDLVVGSIVKDDIVVDMLIIWDLINF